MTGAPTLWRMVALHLARSPLVLGLLPLSLFCVPLLQELRPLATPVSALEVVRAWVFPPALAGAALTLALLANREAFLVRVDPTTRWLGEWGGCVIAPLALQLPIVLGALSARPEGLDLARVLTDILSSDLHLAGLALLALALPIPTPARLLAFLALSWALPSLAAPGVVAQLLDPSRALASSSAALPSALAGFGLALLHALRRAPASASR